VRDFRAAQVAKAFRRAAAPSGAHFWGCSCGAPNFDASETFPDAVAGVALIPYATPFQIEILDYNHFQSPAVLRYSFSAQQFLSGGWRLQAAYVGARGNHLYRGYEANLYPIPVEQPDGSLYFPPNSGPINPSFGAIAVTTTDAQSFYNAMQISAAWTGLRSVSAQANYTYSKSVDDASSASTGTGGLRFSF